MKNPARKCALGLREAQTHAQAARKKGLLLQLTELEIAIDEQDEPKVDRFVRLIKLGVEALAA